jgi:transposase
MPGGAKVLFVGDDWAEDHHDVDLVDEAGRRLARARLVEGLEGVSRLHALIGEHRPREWAELDPVDAARRVKIGIETDRGPWVQALGAAGYEVFAINPMQVARYRERHSTSGAKSDAGDAHVLAEIVRLDREHHRPVAGDTPQAEAVKLVARSHQSLIWDRSRHVLRLRSALREFFPAALAAFDDLAAPDALELLGRAPDPDRGARLSRSQLVAALRRANRRNVPDKATQIHAALRAPALRQPSPVQSAYAAVVSTQVRLIAALNSEIESLGEVVAAHFGRHRDAEIYLSQAGLGTVLGARLSPSSATTPTGSPTPRPARTTPAPHRSPAHPAPARPSWPATPATADSATRYTSGPSAQCADHRGPAAITTLSAPAASATRLRYANSATDSSASSTAASKREPATTRTPPGATTPRPLLDTRTTWDVCRDECAYLPMSGWRPHRMCRDSAGAGMDAGIRIRVGSGQVNGVLVGR